MRSLDRFTTPQASLAVQQHVPAQRAFRDTQAGRVAGDPHSGTPHTAYAVRRWPDGTCDVVRMDADGRDWLDLGGRGAHDVAAGRI